MTDRIGRAVARLRILEVRGPLTRMNRIVFVNGNQIEIGEKRNEPLTIRSGDRLAKREHQCRRRVQSETLG